MRRATLLILTMLLTSAAAFAQAPAAPVVAPKAGATPAGATGGVAVIDFMKAVTSTGAGTMATNKLTAENNKRVAQLQAKQKEGQDAQTQLTTQDKVLSDARKAELSKVIDRAQTDITRMQDDFNKEMQDLQQANLSPIAATVRTVMEKYAAEKGFAVVLDIGSDANSAVFWNPGIDITDAVVLLADEASKVTLPAAKPAAPAAPKPPAAAPAGAKPPVPDPAKKPNP